MAMRLDCENVRIIEHDMINELDYWEMDGKDAEKLLTYIAGIHGMAEAVMKAIRELGGH